MLAIKTRKGGYLIVVNRLYACYVDENFDFLRSVKIDIGVELAWAKETWDQYEEEILPLEEEPALLKQLYYVSEYQKSLEEIAGD